MVEYLGEVEDGWWRGKVGTAVGVFPSNFVEMVQGPGGGREELADKPGPDNKVVVDNKNKRNENMTGEVLCRLYI